MNEQPPALVRLPASRIPEGTAPWRSADARRWLASVPSRRWARPVWPALLLVGAVVWALLAVATPPRPAWSYGELPPSQDSVRRQGPTLGAAPTAEPGSKAAPTVAPGATASPGAKPAPTAAPGSKVAPTVAPGSPDGLARLAPSFPGAPRASVTDRATLLPADGNVHVSVTLMYLTTSRTASGFDAWWVPTALLGLLLLQLYWIWLRPALALAVLAPLTVAGLLHDDVLGAAVLPAQAGVVCAAVLVACHLVYRLAAGVRQRRQAVEAAGPQRHPSPPAPVGRPRGPLVPLAAGALLLTVTVLVCGRAEGEESRWIVLAAGTLGTALLTGGAAAYGQAARHRARPQPALRVLVREGEDGRTWVYAADDRTGTEPLLGFHAWGAYEGEPADAPAAEDPYPLREAVLYGSPALGARLSYTGAVDGPTGRVTVEHSTTPAIPDRRTARPRTAENGTPVSTETPSTSNPLTTVRSWSAGPVARLSALLLVLVESGAALAFLDGDRGWRVWLTLVLLPFTVSYVATGLNWRVTADRSGVWVAGAWRVRQLRWAELEKVGCDDDSLTFRGPKGTRVLVRPTGWAPLDRRTVRGHVAGHAAREIGAMLAAPELRPTDDSTTADQGMPLGPVLVLVAVLGAAAALALQ